MNIYIYIYIFSNNFLLRRHHLAKTFFILQDFIMNAQYYENIVTIENFFNTVFQIVFIPNIQRVTKTLATRLTN